MARILWIFIYGERRGHNSVESIHAIYIMESFFSPEGRGQVQGGPYVVVLRVPGERNPKFEGKDESRPELLMKLK